jgi:methylmalonyl-CoA mutase N-terminal domain/subunit
MDEVDREGGVVACIEKGFIQRRIENSAYEYQKEVEKGDRVIVGVNQYQTEERAGPPLLRIDPAVEEAQIRKLTKLKKERDQDPVSQSLARLKTAARGDENLMPIILEAVKAYATLGEICHVLREVFGEYRYRG